MQAFIIRPFGTKEPCQQEGEIDFDRVEELLIQPALKEVGLEGGTTVKFLEAGNIREDMFAALLKADVVIADVSVHNANVFYELGIRHAMRDKRTLLIRCRGDIFPFDLRTDRYLEYPRHSPEDALSGLIQGLKATLAGDRVDSPVFRLLPQLQAQDWTRYVVVPRDFQQEVEKAIAGKEAGDLEMLATEANWFEWAAEGLRHIGRGQFDLGAWESARATWERILRVQAGDVEAEQKLATIYQRLDERALSDQAIQRALDTRDLPSNDRAELYSLAASNAKTEWLSEWRNLPVDERAARALTSRHLLDAFECYRRGFLEDQRHYYAGINALGFAVIVCELAERDGSAWASCFGEEDEADAKLRWFRKTRDELTGAVYFSVEAAKAKAKREGVRDLWAEVTAADFACLRADRANRVSVAYRNALSHIPEFSYSSARRQLEIYRDLEISKDNVDAALETLAEIEAKSGAPRDALAKATDRRVLLFSGHMVDEADRNKGGLESRFPREDAFEARARAAIEEKIKAELDAHGENFLGIAGGACGGDILFHEVCEQLGVPTRLFLTIPQAGYQVASVQRGGPDWIDRFQRLCDHLKGETRVLAASKELPGWLQKQPGYSIWQRNNLWILRNALAYGGQRVTLIALWDGEAGDKPGGTGDMIVQATARGAKVLHIDIYDLSNR